MSTHPDFLNLGILILRLTFPKTENLNLNLWTKTENIVIFDWDSEEILTRKNLSEKRTKNSSRFLAVCAKKC